MTDFNDKPLAEQLKALQAGDELHTTGEALVVFKRYTDVGAIEAGALRWLKDGTFNGAGDPHYMDIIRVHRPTARKVPEVVGELRELHQAVVDNYVNGSDAKLCTLINILARHHERGEQP